MLIEAAKGGHTTVVNLLLDWPNNIQSPSPDLEQHSPPQSKVDISDVSMLIIQDHHIKRMIFFECYQDYAQAE